MFGMHPLTSNRHSPGGSLICVVGLLLTVLGGHIRDARAQGNVGGVYVDPEGMLRESNTLSEGDLQRQRDDTAYEGQASKAVSAASPLRKVSLRRLEQAVAGLHETGNPLPPDMRYLAGLTAVKFVFVYPETGDVVVAGPAEGWNLLPTGDIVGRRSNRPILQLDDLVVALRYAFASQPASAFLGCSIEPTEQGLKAHAAYVRGLAGIDGSQILPIIRGMEQAIGPQDVHTYGAPATSRFALQMLAADYRLKRIALAHDPSPSKKVPSYLDLAEKAVTGGPQRQHRWWFVGHYDAIRHTPDRLAFELEGTGLKVDTAPAQLKNTVKNTVKNTAAKNSPKPTKAAAQFADLATRNLPDLCEKIAPFAELQNLVGLAVAGVLIRKQAEATSDENGARDGDEIATDLRQERWRPTHFLDESACPIASFETPRHTPPLANARFVKGQFWMFSVSGGVEINPDELARSDTLKPACDGALHEARRQGQAADAAEAWWWD